MKTFIFSHQFENLVWRIPANSKAEALKELQETTPNFADFDFIKVK